MKNSKETTFVTTIRISDELGCKIKAYSEKTGATLNSTISILLDLGLKMANGKGTIRFDK